MADRMSTSSSSSGDEAGFPTPKITILKRRSEDLPFAKSKFMKKTRKGRVMRVLKERYLRSDIPCGYTLCPTCPSYPGYKAILPAEGYTGHSNTLWGGGAGHWVVVDTNVVLHQMDLLQSLPPTLPLIFPQTVLSETLHRSLPLYQRLTQLIGDEDRKCWVYWNEAGRGSVIAAAGSSNGTGVGGGDINMDNQGNKEGNTSVLSLSINDKNDSSIRSTISYYLSHLSIIPLPTGISRHPSLVLLSDDTNNRKKALAEGIHSISVRGYVDGLKDVGLREGLGDLIAGGGVGEVLELEDKEGEKERVLGGKKEIYKEYLPSSTLQAGLSKGIFHSGFYNPNQYNSLEGTVNSSSSQKPILLVGREGINRAVSGDMVVVRLLPQEEWKALGMEVVREDALKDDDADEDAGEQDEDLAAREARLAAKEKRDAEEVARAAPAEKLPTGVVVGILKRGWRPYVCHLDRASLSSAAITSVAQQTVFATPLDSKLPRIRIRTRQTSILLNQKFLVSIDDWPSHSRYPEGHFVRSLGEIEGKAAEQESLLLEYEVPYRPFGKAILKCLPVEGDGWKVPPKGTIGWRDREDLRDLLVCSIDPPGCQDIDDALHARMLPNGNIEAGVHIADVTHFVLPDNPMDTEAAARGTTVYLVDKRIDMLPHLLGTNLCSLQSGVERYAFSAIWELNSEAEIINVRFTKSVIASKESFTYQAAQDRMDDKSLNDPLTNSIRLLNTLARKLKAARMKAGALSLSSPELKIHLDSNENAPEPVDVEKKALLDTNSLVEEFMLLANISVATKIQESYPQTAVLRRHNPPPSTNFETLQDILLKRRGMTLDVSSSGALAASLDACVDPDEPEFNTLVRIMATRCMLAAEYISAGSVSKDTYRHYGLASPIYTHFTSPIRRYADVLAHRQLAAAIGYTPLHPSLQTKSVVERVLNNVNKRHRLAQMAGRASVEFYVGLSLKNRGLKATSKEGGATRESAFVIRAFRNGLAVFVPDLGIEGLITFTKDSHDFDAENYSVKAGGVAVSVFDKVVVDVSIEKDKNFKNTVKMTLVSPIDSTDL